MRVVCISLLMIGALSSASAGVLPDPQLTPGACTPMSKKTLCETKWGKDARHVTAAMKRQVFASYGVNPKSTRDCSRGKHKSLYEIDHLCSRELGGQDVTENLWPQCYSGTYNATMKDKLENRLHKEVCAGNMSLEHAQEIITTDWTKAYRQIFGTSASSRERLVKGRKR